MHGAIIEAPCINRSYPITTIQDKTIHLGFHIIHELEKKNVEQIIDNRPSPTGFDSLEDFMNLVPISLEQVKILIRIGAFRIINPNKKALLWKAHLLTFQSRSTTLFNPKPKQYKLPPLHHDPREDGFDEMELLGFPLKDPFSLTHAYTKPHVLAQNIHLYKKQSVTIIGYLIATKSTRTSDRKRMYFGTFLDQAGDFIDTVHFPPVASKYPIRGSGVYEIIGKVVEEFDFLSIEVSSLKKIHYINMEDVDTTNLKQQAIQIKA